MWFTTGSGAIEIQMTRKQANSAAHSGPCDEDVMALSKEPIFSGRSCESTARGVGRIWRRILWLAAGDITDRI